VGYYNNIYYVLCETINTISLIPSSQGPQHSTGWKQNTMAMDTTIQ